MTRSLSLSLAVLLFTGAAANAADGLEHFDPKGQPASTFTLALRNGLPGGLPPRSTGPDVVRAMSTGHWLDFLGISMDPKKAEGARYTVNLVTPDNGEKYAVELSNATLTNIEGFQAPTPDLTITLNRADLNRVMMGVASFDQLVQEGKARFDGDSSVIHKLRDLMVTFTPDFEILPGTAPTQRQVPPGRPFALPDAVNTIGE
jgi:alkyl sulfatase BDS1-like metallo-beta-lactamase superfamily hydrolase